MIRTFIAVFLLIGVFFSGCVLFKPLDRVIVDAATGLEKEYDINLDTLTHRIGKNTMEGVVDGLTSDTSLVRIDSALAEILAQLKVSINEMLRESIDSALSPHTEMLLMQRIEGLSETLKIKLGEILDDPVRSKVKLLVADIMNELLGDSTLNKLTAMRDTLLGPQLQVLIDSIISSAITELALNYETKLKSQIEGTLSVAGQTVDKTVKNFKSLAWVLGGIALVLLIVGGYIYLRGRRHKATLKILTSEIDNIKEQKVYDKLIGAITMHAKNSGLHPHLQGVLTEQKLHRQPEWQAKDKQVLNLMSKHLSKVKNEKEHAKLMESIQEEASSIGLDEHLLSVLSRNPEARKN
ncbi:MAG: hypothetical protein IIA45_02880 [Bacteroidetes bacterium]|nr:hypothetical protein [Bacteroidota bacterium]